MPWYTGYGRDCSTGMLNCWPVSDSQKMMVVESSPEEDDDDDDDDDGMVASREDKLSRVTTQ